MLPRTIRRISTAVMWIGVGLIATGAVVPALTPNAVVRATPSSAAQGGPSAPESKNPDQVLRDEAEAVRRRVEEFRERSRAEEGGVDAASVCYLIGAGLVLGGLVGRLASARRDLDVEPR